MNILLKILSIFYYCLLSFVLKFVPKKLRYKSIVGEIVAITGAGRGLGRALALRFAKLGANVVLLDILEPELLETKKLIEKQFSECLVKIYLCDVTDRHQVYKIAQQINKDVGFVSILVNNAGVLYGKTILELTDNNIINTFNVNTLSHFWTIRAFLPNMLTANTGHIVSIASLAGKTGSAQMTDYCGSKHAVIGLNESLRLELMMNPKNRIQTTTICPTIFNTTMINGMNPSSLISVIELNEVADQTIAAVLTNDEIAFIPSYLNLVVIFQNILPVKALIKIYDIIGGYRLMNQFKGNN